jgi:hypothetical protein
MLGDVRTAETVSKGFGTQVPLLSHVPVWPDMLHAVPDAEVLHEGPLLLLHEL